jgi:flavin-dependent dehydrogenase
MSVGIVMHKSAYKARQPCTSREAYLASIAECKLFQGMIAEAELVSDVKIETDYSYVSDRFAGPGYFMVGDAACFIDPLLSSGVHLAMLAAMIASASIISATLGDVTAVEGRNFFEKCYRNAYLRFMVFVSVFYQKSGVQEQCFREAQKLTAADVHGADLKQAFLHLVSGLEDMQDAGDVFHRTILEEVGKNLEENVDLRMDKTRLHDAQRNETARVQNNARFFDAIEGLFSISREVPVDGLYVSTSPRLQLARV